MSAFAATRRGMVQKTTSGLKPVRLAVILCVFATLVCGVYLASHYRYQIAAGFEAANATAGRYQAVGMLSVP